MAPSRVWPSRKGFTLTELLVVIGVVAVLIALLMPALTRARAHVVRVKCQANLRSIGQAMTMYVQQYGYYPGCQLNVNVSPNVWQVGPALWPIRLRAYTAGDQGVFYCPAQDQRCEWKKNDSASGPRATGVHARFGYQEGERLLSAHGTWFSYGYNAWGRSIDSTSGCYRGLGWLVADDPRLLASISAPLDRRLYTEVPATRVRKPPEMVAVTDATADGWNDFAVCPNPQYTGELLPGAVHDKGANVLFCDGHVQWYSQKELTNIYGSGGGDAGAAAVAQMRRMWDVEHRP